MTTGAQLRIVIPAHNEQSRIARTLHDYCSTFSGIGNVLVVANGCTDATVAIVESLCHEYTNLSLIDIRAQIGKGGAVRVGFKTGTEPYVGFTDADCSTSAQEFLELYDSLVASTGGGIIGSRWNTDSVVTPAQPASRRIASRIFNSIVRLLFGLRFRDTQCGAKLFARNAVREVLFDLELSNFAFDIDLLWQLQRHGVVVVEKGIRWSDSSGSRVKLLSASASMFLAIVRLRLRHSPLSWIPFLEYMAREAAIPVYDRIRFLVLCDRSTDSATTTIVRAFVERLRVADHYVSLREGSANPISRLGALLRYLWRDHSQCDAIVELRSALPQYMVRFSSKPYALIESTHDPGDENRYSRATKIKLDAIRTLSSQEFVSLLFRQRPYCALFVEDDGKWTIDFAETATGLSKRQLL